MFCDWNGLQCHSDFYFDIHNTKFFRGAIIIQCFFISTLFHLFSEYNYKLTTTSNVLHLIYTHVYPLLHIQRTTYSDRRFISELQMLTRKRITTAAENPMMRLPGITANVLKKGSSTPPTQGVGSVTGKVWAKQQATKAASRIKSLKFIFLLLFRLWYQRKIPMSLIRYLVFID